MCRNWRIRRIDSPCGPLAVWGGKILRANAPRGDVMEAAGLADPHEDDDFPSLFSLRDGGTRALERVGIVDVGSNSVRMVMFDGAARSPAYFFNEKILCGLGEGLAQSGKLNPEGRARALAALKRFRLLADGMDAPLTCVATAAVREADDGPDFSAEVLAATGLRLWVATGQEEARLSAQGVLLGWPDARGVVCDIGGASMELAEIAGGKVGRAVTSELGPLKLEGAFPDPGDMDREIELVIKGLHDRLDGDYEELFLVGGSWRAIARLDMERRDYPLKVLHEYEMSAENLLDTCAWIATQTVDELRGLTGSSLARMSLVPTAAKVLIRLIETFGPKRIATSSYGIREGLLYEQMPADLKSRDPLIEAAMHMEIASARVPGFGKMLYRFIRPIFADEPSRHRRLYKAACLLHDVTWRAHPDYRAEVCFDNATRANLGGLDHAGRVFLGTALLYRYRNSRSGTAFAMLSGLIDEDIRKRAEIIGKAMRFGAMMSGSASDQLGRLNLDKPGVVELILPRHLADLFGEVVEDRFQSLAGSLDRDPLVTIDG